MQKPTSEAIKERVSEELDEQLPDHVSGLVVESAIKTSSKRKRRAAAKKKNRSNIGTTHQNVVQNQETEFVEEVSSLTEMGEVQETAEIAQPNIYDQAPTRGRFNVGSSRGIFQARGRGGRPFVRHTGENDPYDMSIAPLFIYEIQVLPIGIHNLSKSFRPSLATIRVLSLGTKFIPKWKFEKRNNAFKFFNDFIRKMNNKVYFTETRPGFFERNARFTLKTNFVANIQYKEINLFGWRVREKINEVIERMVKQKFGQNMSNKEKSALRNLIRAKNKSIVINDTDKNMGAADSDKKDLIEECERKT